MSPDGRQLAVGIDDGKEANVWIYDLSSASAIRRLTFGGKNRYPIWTSDSARVAFQSDREGDSAIFWQRTDGTGATERITKPDKGQAHIPNAWSPKGDSFLFSVGSGSNQSLWTFSLQDKKAAPFGAVRNSSLSPNAAFSPNGRWIAYASNETDRQAVFVQPFPATGAKYQIAVGNNPFWAPDGKELFFSPEGVQVVFMVVSVKTEPTFTFGNPTSVPRPRAVLRGHFPNPRNYDIAPEGNRFVIVVDASDTATDAGSAPRIQVVLNWFEELNARVPSGQ